MRSTVLLTCLLLLAPAAADEMTPLHEGCPDDPPAAHEECHEDNESPGVGWVAAFGAVALMAWAARRK